jgi:heme/copper-type cytochrome/quinol oxidase subunit 4
MDKESRIFITALIFAGCMILLNLFGGMYILNNMQHQIDELHKENIKQNMRIGILERI